MKADNEFLTMLINKLSDIAEGTNDAETKHELDELIHVIVESGG
ncbi:hypothetical protein NST33_17835 [Paenibacillus sp. FSL L8-0435]